MQANDDMIGDGTTLVLTTDSDLFGFLRGMRTEPSAFGDPTTLGNGSNASAPDEPVR
ncbi:hypothetical protein M8744_03850 [Lutimaribacter sp. EGI FJ00013]|uniref:Uncharacterized protein n=1 Tax=Lutimaribacter degradans TaxID=2945989 RepID=A0ACC5ZSL8_9RHOB|nr:hypothetical protein [Lutimaribacter sp. EGI FJ00013]MCM2561272.1 hypothetical protein [Lutimaribacter sp. EGI FJ00013]